MNFSARNFEYMCGSAFTDLLSTFSTISPASRPLPLHDFWMLSFLCVGAWTSGPQPPCLHWVPIQTLQEERGSDWSINQYSVPHNPAGLDSPLRPCNMPGAPLRSSLLTVCLWVCCQSLVWSESSLFFFHYKRSLNIKKR